MLESIRNGSSRSVLFIADRGGEETSYEFRDNRIVVGSILTPNSRHIIDLLLHALV